MLIIHDGQAFKIPQSALVTGDTRMSKIVPIFKGLKNLNEKKNKKGDHNIVKVHY